MRELDCDFCGAPADGAYEVVPPELSPGPDEQARVVLCGGCRGTLDGLLAPLLDRLDGGAVDADASGDASLTADAAGHVRPGTTSGPAAARAAAGERAADRAASSGADGLGGGGHGEDDRGEPADVRGEADGDAEGDVHDEGDRDGDDGEHGDAEGGGDDGDGATPDEPGVAGESGRTEGSERGEGSGTLEPNGTAAGNTAPPDAPSVDATAPGAAGEEPEHFRTVMRLLANREFPVERAAVTELAGGAYDIEPEAVDRVVDYAVERGLLAEEDGELVRG